MKKISGFGGYPLINANCLVIEKQTVLKTSSMSTIPRGLGRSYGDSALANNVLITKKINRFIAFDQQTGILTLDAGISLDEILTTFVIKGWFLPVTPGTKFVTVGGAIASDIHGKNHHHAGCFSDHVLSFKLQIGADNYHCSRTNNAELFYATCGGMGLTGLIIEATIKLIAIKSAYINQKIIKINNLAELLIKFNQFKNYTYSVAWIDSLATKNKQGRSLLMLGEHANNYNLNAHNNSKISIPFNLPLCPLNKYSIKAFNFLYYHRIIKQQINNTIHYDKFFYPLDGINNWNRIYGKQGFTQYQLVVPKESGLEALSIVLTEISKYQQGSFLSVLKEFGATNKNYLSFPIEGYTLAVDFKITKDLYDFLNKLDDIVNHYGGRIYLTKDMRLCSSMFKKYYPQWLEFQHVRTKFNADKMFNSLQSIRLGL